MLVMWDTCEQRDFHNSGGSCCISYQLYNLSVLLQYLHQSLTTSVCGSASCHVGSCIWTWVSDNLNPLSPALSMIWPKPAAWPKVTAAPYICPPALCPSPSVLGTVGVGVRFGQGMTPGNGSKGGWRACGGSDGWWRVAVAFCLVRILLKKSLSLDFNRNTAVAFGKIDPQF